MRLTTIALLTILTGCGFIGGGETVISGDDNLVVSDPVIDRVAAHLAGLEATPEVTDEDLAVMYATIRQGATAGDLDAVLVVLKIAALQREPDEADTE